jgi:hypothetical protein
VALWTRLAPSPLDGGGMAPDRCASRGKWPRTRRSSASLRKGTR